MWGLQCRLLGDLSGLVPNAASESSYLWSSRAGDAVLLQWGPWHDSVFPEPCVTVWPARETGPRLQAASGGFQGLQLSLALNTSSGCPWLDLSMAVIS